MIIGVVLIKWETTVVTLKLRHRKYNGKGLVIVIRDNGVTLISRGYKGLSKWVIPRFAVC